MKVTYLFQNYLYLYLYIYIYSFIADYIGSLTSGFYQGKIPSKYKAHVEKYNDIFARERYSSIIVLKLEYVSESPIYPTPEFLIQRVCIGVQQFLKRYQCCWYWCWPKNHMLRTTVLEDSDFQTLTCTQITWGIVGHGNSAFLISSQVIIIFLVCRSDQTRLLGCLAQKGG